MALTPSTMLQLATKAPEFTLPDTVSGNTVSLDDTKGERGTLIMFICNHCPYVKHIRGELVRIANDYQRQGISMVAISSNDVENYPEDSPELMREEARTHGYKFPYLYDETQEVARAYKAACTPDFFLFDGQLELVYRGRLDDSTPGNGNALTGKDLRQAMDDLLNGNPVSEQQHPSMGCNIKWKE